MKKNVVSLTGILVVMLLTACSNKPEVSEGAAQNVQTEQEATGVEQETEIMADDLPVQQGEISQSETTVIESNNQDKAICLQLKMRKQFKFCRRMTIVLDNMEDLHIRKKEMFLLLKMNL